MAKWIVGVTYGGAELLEAPAGTIVQDSYGNLKCKLPAKGWDHDRWEGGLKPSRRYKVLALPSDGEVREGEIYPANRLHDLPDGTVLADFFFGRIEKIVKYEGEWVGKVAACIHESSYFPLRVLKLPTLVGQCFTGEQLREHTIKGLVVEDDDGETAVFNGDEWVGDGHLPTAQPGRFFRVVSVPD